MLGCWADGPSSTTNVMSYAEPSEASPCMTACSKYCPVSKKHIQSTYNPTSFLLYIESAHDLIPRPRLFGYPNAIPCPFHPTQFPHSTRNYYCSLANHPQI